MLSFKNVASQSRHVCVCVYYIAGEHKEASPRISMSSEWLCVCLLASHILYVVGVYGCHAMCSANCIVSHVLYVAHSLVR